MQKIQTGISSGHSKLWGRQRDADESIANGSGYIGYGLYTVDGKHTYLPGTPYEYIAKSGQFYGHLIEEVAVFKPRYPVN